MRGTYIKISILMAFLWSLGALTPGCGEIGLGGGGIANDPAPSGTKTKQGVFQGQNGQTVSGTASIYVDGTTVTLRLENLGVPSGTVLKVVAKSSSTQVLSKSLRATSGNQNYTMSSTQGATTDTVEIQSGTVAPPSNVYGVATLQSVL